MNHEKSPQPSVWLRLHGVSLRLGGRLFLRDFDWTLRDGEQWAVVGANGSGKSVLAQLITGALHPGGGEIEFTPPLRPERDIGQVSFELQQQLCEDDRRHDISEFMENAVDAGTTVAALLGAAETDANVVASVAHRLGIDALLGRGLRFLSSGEMRRTLIARVLLMKPKVVVLDNPYEGIDADSRRIVRDIVSDLLSASAHLILLTRQVDEIPATITHVLLLEQGHVTAIGTRASVLSSAAAVRLSDNSTAADVQRPLPRADTPTDAGIDDAEPLIELRQVHARYGDVPVLEAIDLRLGRGEHLCIAGPNGCGKSTLLSLICGDNPRAYGQHVRLFGRLRGSGESVWEIKRRFGIVSNQLHLEYPRRATAFAVVASGFFDTLGLYDDCGPAQIDTARQWLALLGLAERARARFDTLSFGEQRMMLIARAMVKSPPVLTLDEPCSGLDAANRRRVLALVDRIAAETTTQILYVSHEIAEMPACITRRLEFRRGGGTTYRLVEG
jgi:molybdate transport system ATP-binding protein